MFIQKKLNQKGIMNPLIIPLILAVLILIGTSVTTVMYYNRFVKQRDENTPIIDAAVKTATTEQNIKLQNEFTEREKLPTKLYITPSALGSVKLNIPKTWSSYVAADSGGLEYYGHPGFVPSSGVNYALRTSIKVGTIANDLKVYDGLVKRGDLKASAIQVAGTTGTRLDGFLKKDQEGSMVIFPLRDKVLKIWTESKDFRGDFDNIVLKGLTFVP